ncbi:MAG: histidine phosphatase family protein [Ardenticatenaceae bacterium]|nr:histidine phosphatase family protein [Anaerolineales bacterium]MCB8920529.1 histidine phosphatase family protein [Ardenticatenaceae bacterium]MCB8989472.1 histidine phosphatase family protein [Ardenticatenaceae bacterium]MCB9004990.1 histidine phosphatase family protein [Ardenticatenaceae bacterium]
MQQPGAPANEWRLSENGRTLAAQLAPELRPYTPTRIITSEEAKAAETGQLIAAELGLPWHTAPGLQEHDRRGVPFFATREAFETAVAHFFAHPNQLVFGNETAAQALGRMEMAVAAQRAAYPHDTLILVTHGTVLTLYCCHRNPQLDPLTFWRSLTLPWWGIIRDQKPVFGNQ